MILAFICGGKARSCYARCGILLLFFLLPHQTYPQPCSSSCGKISNITHPFRLKHDPAHCGDNRYELDCVNNVTVLNLLYAGKHYVQSINYNNYTIRLVDPNIQPTNCSSLPRFFFPTYNYSYSYDPYQYYLDEYNTAEDHYLFRPIIYMNCTSPPSDDAYYVDTASCVDQHTYAIVGDLEFGRLKPQCHVKILSLTSFWGPGDRYGYDHIGNVSYIDIHRALLYGFELSWLQGSCPCSYCSLIKDTDKIYCYEHESSCIDKGDCGFWRNMLILVEGFWHNMLILVQGSGLAPDSLDTLLRVSFQCGTK